MKENKVCKIYIERRGDDYHYLIEDPSRGISSFRDRMTVPPSSRDRILKKVGFFHAIGGWSTIIETEVEKNEGQKENPEKIGRLIFKYMISPSCKEYLSKIDTEYLVLSTNDVEIPWELMHDGTDFYCLKYSMGRKVQARVQFKSVKREKADKLNALFMANPTEDLPDAEKEVDTIITNLQGEKNIKFQYLKGEDATIGSLLDMLESERFDIFHYAGHANFNTKYPEESIIKLYDGDITAKYLLNLFEDIPPRLVFMNACESATTKDIEYLEYEGKLTGIATAFISAGVDAYIGTLWPVHDSISSELSLTFYRRILKGEPIGFALKEIKKDIFERYGGSSISGAAFILYGSPNYIPEILLKMPAKDESIDPLINILNHGDEKARVEAALILGETGDERALDALINALAINKDKDILWSCIDALGKIGSEKAVEPLINLFNEVDEDLQVGIVYTLGKIPDEKAVNVLIGLLYKKDPYIKWHAIDALGKIGDKRTVRHLINALKDEDKCIRWWTLDALIKIGGEEIIEGVKKAAEDNEEAIQRKALKALGVLQNKSSKIINL